MIHKQAYLLGFQICIPQWSLPKRTLREADNLVQWTNLVARIDFAKLVIVKQSTRCGKLRIPNDGQGTGPEWRVLIQNYFPRTDNQKLHPIIFMDITEFT